MEESVQSQDHQHELAEAYLAFAGEALSLGFSNFCANCGEPRCDYLATESAGRCDNCMARVTLEDLCEPRCSPHRAERPAHLAPVPDREEIAHLFNNVRAASAPWEFNADCPTPHAGGSGGKVSAKFNRGEQLWFLKCYAGCTCREIAEGAGLDLARVDTPVRVRDLAVAFALPEEFLAEWGLADTDVPRPGVRIAHRDAQGNTAMQFRLRLAKSGAGDNRFWNQKGTKLLPFGADRLGDADCALFVEGSSDIMVLAYNGFAALGVPGKTTPSTLAEGHVRNLKRIVAFVEPNATDFVKKISKRLAQLRWTGELVRFTAADIGAKDPRDLWTGLREQHGDDEDAAREEFRRIMDAAIASATPPTPDELSAAGSQYVDQALFAEMDKQLAVMEKPAGAILYMTDAAPYQIVQPRAMHIMFSKDTDRFGGDPFLLWAKRPERPQIKGIEFSPAGTTPGYYNLWQGFGVEPAQGDCSRIKDHLLTIICAGDEANFQWLWRWLGTMVQHPEVVPGTAPVFRSKPGSGKNQCVYYIAKMLRPDNFFEANDIEDILGKHVPRLLHTLLLHANEAVWGGEKKREGILKGRVTDDKLNIQPKFVDTFTVKSALHFIFSSNSDHPVPVGGNDRRFALFDVSEARMQDEKYFAALEYERDHGGAEALLQELLQTDLMGFNVRRIPSTLQPTDLAVRSSTAVQQWIRTALYDGEFKHALRDEKVPLGICAKDDIWDSVIKAVLLARERPPHREQLFKDFYGKYKIAKDGGRPTVAVDVKQGDEVRRVSKRIYMVEFLELARARRNFCTELGWPETLWDGAIDPADVGESDM